MKSRFLVFLLASAFAIAGTPDAPDFSKYPKSDGFDYFIRAHRSGNFLERRIIDRRQKVDSTSPSFDPLLLAISHFWRDSDRSALAYFVTSSGYATDCRHIHSWAVQASHEKQLSPEQLTKLKDAMANLPKLNTYPPMGQLVIISFRAGDTWVTRTCRPEDVQSVYAILGERFETARQSK